MYSRFTRFAVGATVALSLFGAVGVAQASGLTSAQVSAIISLLQSFGADQSVISSVSATLGGQPSDSLSCASFADVSYGDFDNNPGGRVSQLQTWLGISSSTFGFGTYGRKTRALWNSQCGGVQTTQPNQQPTPPATPAYTSSAKSILVPDTLKIVSPSSDTVVAVGQKITISYSVGGNIVAGDPAIVERKIVNAGTDTSVAGYVPVSVSGGTYTFDWTPPQAGKYQALLSISYNNTIYPARSGVITAGTVTAPVPTNTNSTPSITFSTISSGNVIGSFANLPTNSQIRFVNATTGQRYDAQSTMVWSGGSGQLSIAVPNDLPGGSYYLRATDYYNPNTTLAQSSSFQAGTTVAQSSATIDQSSLTQSTTSFSVTGSATYSSGVNVILTAYTYDRSTYESYTTMAGQVGKDGIYSASSVVNSSGMSQAQWNAYYRYVAPGSYTVLVYNSNTNKLLATGQLSVTGNAPTPVPSATIDQSSLTSSSAHPTITGSAQNVSTLGLSISNGGDKFDGTGTFAVSGGRWSIVLNNQTYTPGTYGISVYDGSNNLLTSGTLTVSAKGY